MRILLLDELNLVREILRQFLVSKNQEVVASCATAEEAITFLREHPVDVVLLGDDPLNKTIDRFLRAHRDERLSGLIVCICSRLTPRGVDAALSLRARAIVSQRNAPQTLLDALQTVQDGALWLDPCATPEDPVMRKNGRGQSSRPFTPREQGVIQAVVDGLSNKEIGERLGTSEIAVKASLQHIFTKTGVRTRGQLIKLALQSE